MSGSRRSMASVYPLGHSPRTLSRVVTGVGCGPFEHRDRQGLAASDAVAAVLGHDDGYGARGRVVGGPTTDEVVAALNSESHYVATNQQMYSSASQKN
ncbi:hypothetical protein [Rhodococcus sp. APC 3903]|uniref:hypothetical protein n=1 Tax=Rhodococcus sp. APC 3903 TaxID=3035193 RepID=UPI0025B30A59|nr:hypothetical protein [Rhodococcus sp. APC 3903]MDN3461077.1 hypothetical protein [Rhodococcus sp. APC 3903]